MTAAGSGKVQHHPYIKPPNSRKKKSKRAEFVSTVLPHLKHDEIELFLSLNDDDALKELALAHGYEDKEIKDIIKK